MTNLAILTDVITRRAPRVDCSLARCHEEELRRKSRGAIRSVLIEIFLTADFKPQ